MTKRGSLIPRPNQNFVAEAIAEEAVRSEPMFRPPKCSTRVEYYGSGCSPLRRKSSGAFKTRLERKLASLSNVECASMQKRTSPPSISAFIETSNGLFANIRQSQLTLWTFAVVTVLGIVCRKRLRPDWWFIAIVGGFWFTCFVSWCLLVVVVVGHFFDGVYGKPLRYVSQKLFGFAGNFTEKDNFPPQEFYIHNNSPRSSGLTSPQSEINISGPGSPAGTKRNSKPNSRASSPTPSVASNPTSEKLFVEQQQPQQPVFWQRRMSIEQRYYGPVLSVRN